MSTWVYPGPIYRALNPIHARTPLFGRGAALYGARFKRKGREALYTALDPVTALREANQVGAPQPTTVVAFHAVVSAVFDARDDGALASYGMTGAGLADPEWRLAMRQHGVAPTQAFADRLLAAGFAGLLGEHEEPWGLPTALKMPRFTLNHWARLLVPALRLAASE